MPTTILASRYNTLRDQVNLVLGFSTAPSPQYGYGQTFSTSGVNGTRAAADPTDADKVTAQGYEDLYIDLIRTRSHQVGPTVAIDEFVVGDYETNGATTDKIEESYILGLESLAANIVTDKFNVYASNLTIQPLPAASSTKPSSSWSTKIWQIFTVTFATELDRRHFFNAGGQIRFSATVNYTGSQAKTVDWQSMLGSMGVTSFKATQTTNALGVGSGTNTGNYDLSNGYRQVYSRSSGSVYANNVYRIYAAEQATSDSTSAIRFKVEMQDGSPTNSSWGIDEYVTGTFNSIIETSSANSEILINGTTHEAVVNPIFPTGNILRPLSGY
tara:strand:- start:826 stop:1812 length:987 start_codon:yes stop_codon:yes gene_type:complete